MSIRHLIFRYAPFSDLRVFIGETKNNEKTIEEFEKSIQNAFSTPLTPTSFTYKGEDVKVFQYKKVNPGSSDTFRLIYLWDYKNFVFLMMTDMEDISTQTRQIAKDIIDKYA